MTQYDLNLRDYWRIIRRRKWIILLVPVAFAVAAYTMAYLRAPVPLYRATAAVRFERTLNVTEFLLRDMISVSPLGDLETQAALVESFPVLSRAAKKLGLIPAGATPEAIQASPTYQEVIRGLPRHLEVSRTSRTSLIEIAATSPRPDEAARIANSVTEAFQENDAETRTRQITEARRFIEVQLTEVGQRLRQSEEQLRAFQETNEALLLQDEARTALQRLAELEAEREQVQREIRAAELQIRLLNDGAGDGGLSGNAADPGVTKLRATLAELESERDNLLLTLRPHHPQVRGVEARIANLQRQMDELLASNRARQVESLSSTLELLRARRDGVARAIATLRAKQATLPAVSLEAARIEREVKVNERIFSLLKERLQEALIKEKEQVGEVTIVRPAMVPSVPINPPQARSRAAVGLLLGLVVGLVLAFVVEALDTSIGAIEEVESLLGTPVLGVIPYVAPKALAAEEGGTGEDARHRYAFLPTLFADKSPVAEAFRGLRTNLLFAVLERDVKTIMITSAAQMEGKTTVAVNLAVTLAQLGKRTLLVEADLRNPFIRHVFGIPKEAGLTEAVLGSATLEEVTLGFSDLMLGTAGMERLLDSPGMDNLFLLPSGHQAPNPAELVSSHGLVDVLAAAREQFDYVILDSAPILSVADAAVLASRVDGILPIVRVGHVPRAALRRAKVLLEGTKTPLLGVCLTGVRAEVSPDYAEMAYYRYRYGPRPATGRAARALKPALWRRILSRNTLAGVLVGLLALGTWAWGFSRWSRAWSARSAPRVQAPAPSQSPSSEGQAHAAAPAPAPASAFSLELPASAPGGGRILLGEFPTRADAEAHGWALVRAGAIPSFSVVTVQGPAP